MSTGRNATPGHVLDIPDVVEAQRLYGEPDYLLRVAVRDSEAYEHVYTNRLAALPRAAGKIADRDEDHPRRAHPPDRLTPAAPAVLYDRHARSLHGDFARRVGAADAFELVTETVAKA